MIRTLSLATLLLAPPAWACAVCGGSIDDRSQGTYLVMTLIISALPLALLGGLVGFVAWRSRTAEPEAPAPVPLPTETAKGP